MQFLQGFLAGLARLWSKGCLGKAAVILGGLFVLGLCGAITGGGPAAGPAPGVTAGPAATLAATRQPTEAPAPTEAPQPTATPRPTATPYPTPPATLAPLPTRGPAPQQPASFDSNGDGKVTCADFSTQAAAQRALEAGHKNLDGNDKDGRACESLP